MQNSWLKAPRISYGQLRRIRQKHGTEGQWGRLETGFGSGAGTHCRSIDGGLIRKGHPVLRLLPQNE